MTMPGEQLDSTIVYERDVHHQYFGLKTFECLYLLRINDKVSERLQHMPIPMCVSFGTHGNNMKPTVQTCNFMS